VGGPEAYRTTTGDLPQSQAFKLQSKNFFDLAHRQSPGWQADPPFRGEAAWHCVVQRCSACGNHSGETERDSGVSLKLFGFIAESAFALIPESCSGSSRNAVRHHPGKSFILPRIPQLTAVDRATCAAWARTNPVYGFGTAV
jgi:hypothetical protein